MTVPRDDEAPLEEAIELLVYAPLGFALEARSLLPRFIDRGRNQVAMARVVGKFAVRKGREDLEALALERQEQVIGLMQLLGVGRPATPDAASPPPRGPATPSPRPTLRAVRDEPDIDPGTLAIPDYDSLSASQVVPRLDGLEAEELDVVRRYEEGTRGRRTILSKIATLQQSA